MTFLELLTELSKLQITLSVTQDSISTNVPASQIPEHIRTVLRLNKIILIELFHIRLSTDEAADAVPVKLPGDEIEF